MEDDEWEVPSHLLGYLLKGFANAEGMELAVRFQRNGLAHPGDRFGEVFAWMWEHDRDWAVSLVSDLFDTARATCADAEGCDMVTRDDLIRGMQFALHRTDLSDRESFEKVTEAIEDELPL